MRKDPSCLVEALHYYYSHKLVPKSWTSGLEGKPVHGHGLWPFYQGLHLEMQRSAVCLKMR